MPFELMNERKPVPFNLAHATEGNDEWKHRSQARALKLTAQCLEIDMPYIYCSALVTKRYRVSLSYSDYETLSKLVSFL
jgi:hypothetical protein